MKLTICLLKKDFRDCEKSIYEKKEKYSVSEMFPCELKFVIDICKR